MAFWRRIWQRDGEERLAACTALDVGTEFAKALVFDVDAAGHGTVRGVGRKRQGLSHMQSGTVADIAAVVDNCAVALQEAEEMAGFRPTQVVVGIAGELVKGFTTTHAQERKRPDQPISEGELQRLIDNVQREALREAERAITWETGLPQVDVRLVHAAVTGASIDGYALTNPVGFQGRHVKIGIFNAFAPLVHLGALESVASQLDLELLQIVAEPYAVARVLGSDHIRNAGALFVDVGGGTTDVALVRQGGIEGTRMFALGGRAFTKSLADRLDLPFPRAEALKVDYARGLPVDERDNVASIVGDDVRVWAAGVELVMEELSGGDLLPGRIFLCGGGSRLPEIRASLASEAFWKGLPFARPPEVTVMAPDQIDTISDATELPDRSAGRHAARSRLSGDRAPDGGGRPRRGPSTRPARDEGLTMAEGVIYLDVDDEITSAAARIRSAEGRRVAVVLPHGSRVATSRINFRLLARDALTHEKRLSIVAGDAATRALAASAGLPVFASVGEYEVSDEAPKVRAGNDGEAATGAAAATAPRRRKPAKGAATAAGAAAVGATAGSGAAAGGSDPDTALPHQATLDEMEAAELAAATAAIETVTPPGPAPVPVTSPVPAAAVHEAPTRDERLRSGPMARPATDGPNRTPWLVGLAALGLAVLVVGVGAYLLLPSATISVAPREESVGPIVMTVVADPNAVAPDPGAEPPVVPAEVVEVDVSASATFPATGERVEKEKAKGTVRFRNKDFTSSNTIPKGSVVSTTDGIRFRTDSAVTVARADIVGLQVFPKSASVKVTAVVAGEEGNVEPNTVVVIPRGEDPISLDVNNPDETVGGKREAFPKVTQEDVDKALEALQPQLEAAFLDRLEDPSIASPDATVFPDTRTLGVATPTVDPTTLVDQEIESFELGLTASGTATAVNADPVASVASERLQSTIDADHRLVADSVDVEVDPAVVSNGLIRFPVRATAAQTAVLDPAALKAAVSG